MSLTVQKSVLKLLAIVILFCVPAIAATAATPDPANECDTIAGLRLPFSSTRAVHETQEIDWARGFTVCDAAVRAHPSQIRYVYERGRAEDHTKDYIPALRDFKTVVATGYPEAMVDLGVMYYLGHGVLQNDRTAFDDFSKASAAGSNRALVDLAAMYANGRGVEKDDVKSLDLAEKAVAGGNPIGLEIIADHYFNGAGVPRDYQMAGQYLQQAADLGDGRSMKFLANMYESGYLGPPNSGKAIELRIRAQQVDPNSADPMPAHLPMLRKASSSAGYSSVVHRRRYVTYRYNPAWQAAPGDTSCCPNNMLVCPLGRHFCGH